MLTTRASGSSISLCVLFSIAMNGCGAGDGARKVSNDTEGGDAAADASSGGGTSGGGAGAGGRGTGGASPSGGAGGSGATGGIDAGADASDGASASGGSPPTEASTDGGVDCGTFLGLGDLPGGSVTSFARALSISPAASSTRTPPPCPTREK